jgi:hypothetical protein
MTELRNFQNNVYSQNGEDGVIQEILRRLGIKKGVCCEFGAWDGKHFSNTFNLIKNNQWKGIYIEGDIVKYNDLLKTKSDFPNQIIPVNKYVEIDGENSINNILSKLNITELDILSIDIDSYDYQIMESLKGTKIKPKIVIIEIISSIPVGVHQIHSETNNHSSFTSTLELGIEMGYSLVCHTGNMFFVKNDLIKNNFSDINVNSNELFCRNWIR